jgi:hypothetical protein
MGCAFCPAFHLSTAAFCVVAHIAIELKRLTFASCQNKVTASKGGFGLRFTKILKPTFACASIL